MKKIFIDLGSFKGDTIESAIKTMPDFDEYIGFEPVKELHDMAIKRVGSNPKVKLFNSAAALENGEVDFYVDTQKGKTSYTGSTLMNDKVTGVLVKRKVKGINFPKWLIETRYTDEFIVLKIDIEGFEYPLLEKLLEDGIEAIDILYVEWHWRKIKSINEKRHKDLIQKLKEKGFDLNGDNLDEFNALITRSLINAEGIKNKEG